jgi:hypothetical protein
MLCYYTVFFKSSLFHSVFFSTFMADFLLHSRPIYLSVRCNIFSKIDFAMLIECTFLCCSQSSALSMQLYTSLPILSWRSHSSLAHRPEIGGY